MNAHLQKEELQGRLKKKRAAAAILLTVFCSALFLSGCKTTTPKESNMPWAQPAEWERKDLLEKMGGATY
jgi:hypothetical protein